MLQRSTNALSTAICLVLLSLVLSLMIPGVADAELGIKMFGYFSVNYEDVAELPDGTNDPGEFSFPHMNLMFTSRLSDEFRIYINLAGDDADVVKVRNYWGEYLVNDHFKIRLGEIYRPFGLFNEKLDAVPTYLGIEPPELFDGDHLMLPRTGNLMIHGNVFLGGNILKYAVMTGNKEVIDTGKPVSWDLNYGIGNSLTVGTSGYYSKESGSPILVGEGSPPGGVLPWMDSDEYSVFGGYLQAKLDRLTIKAAYWTSSHDAVRDPNQVKMLYNAGLNSRQMERFGLNDYNPANPDDVSMLNTDGTYTVSTYYIRLGYNLPKGTFSWMPCDVTPFIFWDYYENEETIGNKTFGGDNEAGIADDGKFAKPTVGLVFKPVMNVAVKLDGSLHMYKWTDVNEANPESKDVSYGEIRFDVSYFFK